MQDVCLFAHFDKDNKVDDCVYRYLESLKELDFATVLISSSRLCEADVGRLRGCCCDVMVRENAGLDFGSWAAGFAKHGADIQGRLLLANDSVYGPIGNLAEALDRLTTVRADFYGMVESIEIAPHLQSWFVLLQPWVVRDPAFQAVIAQPFGAMTKRQIVLNGEVGLSRRLIGAGLNYRALHCADRVGLARRHDANPMLLFWRELLCDDGIPFLKVELLRDNPIDGDDAATILQTVATIDPMLSRLIIKHLARSTPRPRRAALARRRYAMMRRHYGFKGQKRSTAGLWNAAKLEALTALVWATRMLRMAFAGRRDPA